MRSPQEAEELGETAARRRLRGLGAEVEEEWFGWRPMTWDELPIIGRAPQLANLVLATGHGMLGVTLFGLLFTPVFYVISTALSELPFKWRKKDLDTRTFTPER